jgi:hypothetical protein
METPDDLRRIPFTTKADFTATAGEPDPVRAFVLQPDKRVLSRRISTIAGALLRGRRANLVTMLMIPFTAFAPQSDALEFADPKKIPLPWRAASRGCPNHRVTPGRRGLMASGAAAHLAAASTCPGCSLFRKNFQS